MVLECFKLRAGDHLVNRVAALEAIRFAAFAFVRQQRDGRQLLNGKIAIRCRTPADRLIVLLGTTQKRPLLYAQRDKSEKWPTPNLNEVLRHEILVFHFDAGILDDFHDIFVGQRYRALGLHAQQLLGDAFLGNLHRQILIPAHDTVAMAAFQAERRTFGQVRIANLAIVGVQCVRFVRRLTGERIRHLGAGKERVVVIVAVEVFLYQSVAVPFVEAQDDAGRSGR